VSVGLSHRLGLEMVNSAFSRFADVASYVCLAGAALELLAYQLGHLDTALWPAGFPLVVTLLALILLNRRHNNYHAVAFLVIGVAATYWFATVIAVLPAVDASNAIPLSFLKMTIILASGSGFAPRSNVLWCTTAFVAVGAASIVAVRHADGTIAADPATVLVEAGLILVFASVSLTELRALRARPQLDRAAIDEEVSAMRFRIEEKAAAIMHDTVLSHLAAVANAEPGELRIELRSAIERDLEVLVGEEWLSDPSPELDSRAKSEWRQSGLLAAIQEAREKSLIVEVTGDLAAVGRLSPARDVAVGLAVTQCLVNVLVHANVQNAEVVVISSENDVSVMVIDAGRGFSEALIGADRLGLRQSVRRRIESVGGDVQIWSTPGRGTSVMMRVPAPIAVEDRAAAVND